MHRAIRGKSQHRLHFTRRNNARVLALTFAAAVSGLVVSGCSSSDRSVAAYCTAFYQQGTKFRSQYEDPNSKNPLNLIVSLISAPQQLATFFGNLAEVAPNSISPQVSQIQNAFQQEANNMGRDATNPLGGLISGVVSSIETGPAFQAVNTWTDTNCGPPPGTRWLNNG
jgi:hypothetical protein